MIFQHTIDAVLAGHKTQTRRLWKPEYIKRLFLIPNYDTDEKGLEAVYNGNRPQWVVGNTYAIQPARGQKAVGRFKVTRLRHEDVRMISEADVQAEGFTSFANFMRVWCKMHDPHPGIMNQFYSSMSNSTFMMLTERNDRPAARYQAVVIDFEVVT
jgi:hypothetical protein